MSLKQQDVAQRQMGEEGSECGRPDQTGGRMEGEKFQSVRICDILVVFVEMFTLQLPLLI